MGYKCKGAINTFTSRRADKYYTSYIDHCAISEDLVDNVELCEILYDDIDNVSDHLPINVKLSISGGYHIYSSSKPQQVGWYKVTKDEIAHLYTDPLEELIIELIERKNIDCNNVDNLSEAGLNELISEISNIFINASKQLPQVKYNKALKPFWNETLSKLSKENKNVRSEWVRAGKPRDQNSTVYMNYKDAKRKFRKEIRRCSFQYEKECIEELNSIQDIDQKFFWYIINKKRKKNGEN